MPEEEEGRVWSTGTVPLCCGMVWTNAAILFLSARAAGAGTRVSGSGRISTRQLVELRNYQGSDGLDEGMGVKRRTKRSAARSRVSENPSRERDCRQRGFGRGNGASIEAETAGDGPGRIWWFTSAVPFFLSSSGGGRVSRSRC